MWVRVHRSPLSLVNLTLPYRHDGEVMDLKRLRWYLTDDQVLEVLVLFETRQMEAARRLVELLKGKRTLTVLEAVKVLEGISNQF